MKEKILAELKKKYSGLSNELLGLIADKLAVKITTDEQIRGGIDELENLPISLPDYATFLQKEGDRRVSTATQTHERTLREKYDFKEKGNTPNPPNPPNPPTPPGPGPDSELAAQVKAVADKLLMMERREQQQQMQDQFIKKLTEEKIPVTFARGRVIEQPEQIDAMLAEAKAEYTEVKQTLINEGLGEGTAPISGNGGPKAKHASKEELDAALSNLKI